MRLRVKSLMLMQQQPAQNEHKDNNNNNSTAIKTTLSGPNELPSIAIISRARSLSKNLITTPHDEITAEDQEAIEHELYDQMKQLNDQNRARGYHGYSGFLEKYGTTVVHEDLDTDADYDGPPDALSAMSSNTLMGGGHRGQTVGKHSAFHSNNSASSSSSELGNLQETQSTAPAMKETANLRTKLENIQSSINKIRGQIGHEDVDFCLEVEQVKLIQDEITAIQDNVEDAVEDLDENVEAQIAQYAEEIQVTKERLKLMKKEKKDREKQEQLKKENDMQQKIEEQQRRIAELEQRPPPPSQLSQPTMLAPSSSQPHTPNNKTRHAHSQSAYFSLDFSPRGARKNKRVRRRSIESERVNMVPVMVDDHDRVDEDDDDDDDDDDEDDDMGDHELTTDDELGVQQYHASHSHQALQVHSRMMQAVPGGAPHSAGGNSPITHYSGGGGGGGTMAYNMNPGAVEGYYPGFAQTYQVQQQQQQQQLQLQQLHQQQQSQQYAREPALISETSIKFIGGVVCVVAGIWIVSKFLDRSNRNQMSISMPNGRRPRILR